MTDRMHRELAAADLPRIARAYHVWRGDKDRPVQYEDVPGFCKATTLADDYGVSVEAMTLRLEELRLLQPGLWNKLKAGGLKVRDAQRELGLSPLAGNDDLLPRHYRHLALETLERGMITERSRRVRRPNWSSR